MCRQVQAQHAVSNPAYQDVKHEVKEREEKHKPRHKKPLNRKELEKRYQEVNIQWAELMAAADLNSASSSSSSSSGSQEKKKRKRAVDDEAEEVSQEQAEAEDVGDATDTDGEDIDDATDTDGDDTDPEVDVDRLDEDPCTPDFADLWQGWNKDKKVRDGHKRLETMSKWPLEDVSKFFGMYDPTTYYADQQYLVMLKHERSIRDLEGNSNSLLLRRQKKHKVAKNRLDLLMAELAILIKRIRTARMRFVSLLLCLCLLFSILLVLGCS